MKQRISFWLIGLLVWGGLVGCGSAQESPVVIGENNAAMNAAATIPTPTATAENSDIEGLVIIPEPSRDHDPDYRYPFMDLPPAGGVHHPVWVNCGVYSEFVPVELAIHSLEHGAVWITYQPELDAAAITTLQNLTRGQTHILLNPYPGQRSPIVLTAWARQLELELADDPRIGQFIAAFLHGRQSPEPGVTCADGVGNPLVLP
ncbi:MAG: DUF3105 domain-containing protein [Anaerolineae bacterium]|nr:DUF3105 domain-containing protein [Anaerolineae bacterium]